MLHTSFTPPTYFLFGAVVTGIVFFTVFSGIVQKKPAIIPSVNQVQATSTVEAMAISTSTQAFVSATSSVVATTAPFPSKTTPVKKISVVPVVSGKMPQVMAWLYPGKPTCGARAEYTDGRSIDVLKPQYFSVGDGGALILLTEQSSGCNGYSPANVADLKKYSKEQYVTISSSDAGNMRMFLSDSINSSSNINTLVSFIVDNKLTGIELDFEDFGNWDAATYTEYKQVVTRLGNALHAQNKKLMIDGPATSNAVEEGWYIWRYADFTSLPVDQVVVMTYDYQFDQGAGQPVSPIPWIQSTIKWILSRFSNVARLSFGIPSYGYRATMGTQKFTLLTYDQMKMEPGFATAQRDAVSGEMTWQSGDTVYFYQDASSMTEKLSVIRVAGIRSVSVWHLGGNQWFSK